ncbi:zinc finger protein 184-like [Pollicipes pollicipes]|uniref:zinc finger protein 184-like n=1 Tax=Pollicipes pollicipes TaxID=41117 RepID=UPI00188583D3|nr:zinc finger protein 184-like [Pollicipes pollicipes]XP_037075910.1 zinc finger protein 184-like [Pollicipes pollicipes]
MDSSNYNPADLGGFQKQLSDMVVTYRQLPHDEQPAAFHMLQASLGPLLTVPAELCSPEPAGAAPAQSPAEPSSVEAPMADIACAELQRETFVARLGDAEGQEASEADEAACPAVPESPSAAEDVQQPGGTAAEPASSGQAAEPVAAGGRRRYICPVATCGRECGHRKAMVLHVKWEHEQGPVCCLACRHEFATHAYFLYHKKSCFQGVSALVCPDCGARFTMELPYRRHLAGHALNACHNCGERLSSRKALVKHLRHEHKIRECEKWFACDKCDKRFMKKRSWLSHSKVHATKDDVQCSHCDLTLSKARLIDHVLKQHGNEPFSCDTCSKRFRRNQQYLQHMRLHEQYDCSLCRKPFVTQADYISHMQSTHQVMPEIMSDSLCRHRCEACGDTFWSHAQLTQHLNKHPDASLECSRCHTEFQSAAQLHRHLRRSLCSRTPELICHQCGAQFCAHFALRKHLARAHGEGGASDRCPHCDYTNSSATNLRRHVAAHQQLSRRYVCDQCAAAFHTLSTLKDHQLYVHTTEKHFVCAECQKAFKTSSSLNRHMRIHSETRPYQCSCGHAYKRMSHLRRHMTAVHNVRTRTRLIARLTDGGAAGSSDSGSDAAAAVPAEPEEPAPTDGSAPYLAGLVGTDQPVTYLADESTLLRVYSVGEELSEFTLPQGVYSTDMVLLPDGSRSIMLKPAGELGQLEAGADGGEAAAAPTATLPPPSTIRSHQRLL